MTQIFQGKTTEAAQLARGQAQGKWLRALGDGGRDERRHGLCVRLVANSESAESTDFETRSGGHWRKQHRISKVQGVSLNKPAPADAKPRSSARILRGVTMTLVGTIVVIIAVRKIAAMWSDFRTAGSPTPLTITADLRAAAMQLQFQGFHRLPHRTTGAGVELG